MSEVKVRPTRNILLHTVEQLSERAAQASCAEDAALYAKAAADLVAAASGLFIAGLPSTNSCSAA